ncbi:MAG: anti-sigma factor [Bacillota bacterium]
MTNKQPRLPEEELIREALHHELHSITPPPADAVWQRIRARLAENGPVSSPAAPPSRRRISWRRMAVLAAALIIVFLGGREILRTGHFAVTERLKGPLNYTDTDVLISEAGKEAGDDTGEQTPESAPHFGVQWEPIDLTALPAHARPPEELSGGYSLTWTAVRQTASGESFTAALYSRAADSLLWLQCAIPDEARFTGALAEILETPLEITGTEAGLLRLHIGGRLALAWQDEDLRRLLWDISGTATENGLYELYNGNF